MLLTALQANEYTAYHLICFSFTHTENTNYDGLVGELHSVQASNPEQANFLTVAPSHDLFKSVNHTVLSASQKRGHKLTVS